MSAGTRVAEHFESLAKQTHAARLGMWIFLSTEVLLFAGLFVVYAASRTMFLPDFELASRHLKTWVGTLNTFILLLSSFLVALALYAARTDRSRLAALLLGASALLGFAFLGFKGYEYYSDIVEGLLPGHLITNPELSTPGGGLFFSIYFMATGLHALHVTIGIAVLVYVALRAWKRQFSADYHTPVELGGMYWHLVDVIWIFLWPLLYLV